MPPFPVIVRGLLVGEASPSNGALPSGPGQRRDQGEATGPPAGPLTEWSRPKWSVMFSEEGLLERKGCWGASRYETRLSRHPQRDSTSLVLLKRTVARTSGKEAVLVLGRSDASPSHIELKLVPTTSAWCQELINRLNKEHEVNRNPKGLKKPRPSMCSIKDSD